MIVFICVFLGYARVTIDMAILRKKSDLGIDETFTITSKGVWIMKRESINLIDNSQPGETFGTTEMILNLVIILTLLILKLVQNQDIM